MVRTWEISLRALSRPLPTISGCSCPEDNEEKSLVYSYMIHVEPAPVHHMQMLAAPSKSGPMKGLLNLVGPCRLQGLVSSRAQREPLNFPSHY